MRPERAEKLVHLRRKQLQASGSAKRVSGVTTMSGDSELGCSPVNVPRM